MFTNDDLVYAYTRHQALEDGVLVDITPTAKKAGFKMPIAVTRAVWIQYCEWTEQDTQNQTYQNTQERIWDIVNLLLMAIRLAADKEKPEIHFHLSIIPRNGAIKSPQKIHLKALIHPGDEEEPVITIMEPNED